MNARGVLEGVLSSEPEVHNTVKSSGPQTWKDAVHIYEDLKKGSNKNYSEVLEGSKRHTYNAALWVETVPGKHLFSKHATVESGASSQTQQHFFVDPSREPQLHVKPEPRHKGGSIKDPFVESKTDCYEGGGGMGPRRRHEFPDNPKLEKYQPPRNPLQLLNAPIHRAKSKVAVDLSYRASDHFNMRLKEIAEKNTSRCHLPKISEPVRLRHERKTFNYISNLPIDPEKYQQLLARDARRSSILTERHYTMGKEVQQRVTGPANNDLFIRSVSGRVTQDGFYHRFQTPQTYNILTGIDNVRRTTADNSTAEPQLWQKVKSLSSVPPQSVTLPAAATAAT